MTVGERIRRRRRALDLTQAQLSQMAGVDKINLSRIESGRDENRIYLRTARLLAEALNVTVDDLLKEE